MAIKRAKDVFDKIKIEEAERLRINVLKAKTGEAMTDEETRSMQERQ